MRRAGRAGALARVALCAAAVYPAGCSGGATRAPTTPGGGTGPVQAPAGSTVSEGYRFVIHPTPDWRLVPPFGVSTVDPEARAAATGRGGERWAAVFVERSAGPLAHDVDVLVTALRGENPAAPVARTPGRFASEPAERVEVGAGNQRVVAVAFEHAGYLYNLRLGGAALDREAENQFLRAFDLLPGEVRGDWRYPPMHDGAGPGYRVRGGRYESAETGLAVEPGARWRLIPPDELSPSQGLGDVALISRDPEVVLLVSAERVPVAHQAGYRAMAAERMLRRMGLPVSQQPVNVTLAGGPSLAMTPFDRSGFYVLHQAYCGGETCVQVQATCGHGDAAAARELLTHTPPGVSLLGAAEREAIARETAAISPEAREAGPGYSMRNGAYVNYPAGIAYRLPGGVRWQARFGAPPSDEGAVVLLTLSSHRLGLAGSLLVEPSVAGTTPEEYHSGVRRANLLGVPREPPAATHLGTVAALWSVGEKETEFGPMTVRVATALRGELAMEVSGNGYPENVAAAGGTVASMIDGLSIAPGPLPALERVGDRLVNHQYGYAVHVPAGVHVEHDGHDGDSGSSDGQFWTSGSTSVAVIAFALPSLSPAGTQERVLQTVTAQVPRDVPDERWRDATLGGRPARRTGWSTGSDDLEVIYATVDRMGYVILTGAPPGAARENVAATFELIE